MERRFVAVLGGLAHANAGTHQFPCGTLVLPGCFGVIPCGTAQAVGRIRIAARRLARMDQPFSLFLGRLVGMIVLLPGITVVLARMNIVLARMVIRLMGMVRGLAQ